MTAQAGPPCSYCARARSGEGWRVAHGIERDPDGSAAARDAAVARGVPLIVAARADIARTFGRRAVGADTHARGMADMLAALTASDADEVLRQVAAAEQAADAP